MKSNLNLSVLDESEVCKIASDVLHDLVGDRAPSAEDLTLSFRVGREQNSLLDLDFEIQHAKGEGIGGYALEWTATVILNLVSALFWTALVKGHKHLSDSGAYARLREDLIAGAGRARTLVASIIDSTRDKVLHRLHGNCE